MSSFVYNEARFRMVDRGAGTIDVEADTLKAMQLGAGYTPDPDHQFVSSVSAHELSGTGYVGGFNGSGRKTLASKAISKVDASDLVKLTADNLTWTALNAGTIRYVAIIKEITNDADSLLVALIEVNPGLGILTDGNDWPLTWGANGVISW